MGGHGCQYCDLRLTISQLRLEFVVDCYVNHQSVFGIRGDRGRRHYATGWKGGGESGVLGTAGADRGHKTLNLGGITARSVDFYRSEM